MKNNFKQKGFTLIEVLIATAIFATMMVMVTGTIGQTGAYQSRLKAMRETSEETRRLSDMITRDVRSANASHQLDAFTFKNGIEIVVKNTSCPGGGCAIDIGTGSGTPGPDIDLDTAPGNILVVTNKDYHIIYYSDSGSVYYKKLQNTGSNFTNDYVGFFTSGDYLNNKISNPNLNVSIKFGGYAQSDQNNFSTYPQQQPYVKFRVVAEASGVGANHYKAQIDSAVTGRSYNQ